MTSINYNKLKLLKLSLVFLLVIICCFYFFKTSSYAKYKSEIESSIDTEIAKWSIFLNNENITDTFEKSININDITWESTHTEKNHAAPGSNGYFTIEIDASTTEIAFKYDINYTDKSIDDNYVLTVSSITSSDGFLVYTKEHNYTGLFSLDDIDNKKKKIITINVYWKNDDQTDFDSLVDANSKYLDLKFSATQYHGENIVEYSKQK